MIDVRKSSDRGFADHKWLRTYHTFSFADYRDPKFMGFRSLRVINEDYIKAGNGFGTHAHQDMEILTYVISGSLEHKDSMGNGSLIIPGELQYMSAGSGVTHSEFNPSDVHDTHLLQIWILPESRGLKPLYNQKKFEESSFKNRLNLLASADGVEDSIAIRQDVNLFAAKLSKSASLAFAVRPARFVWVQVVKGMLGVNKAALGPGDGAALTDEVLIDLHAKEEQTEFLLFDLN